MSKRIVVLLMTFTIILLTACGNKTLKNAQTAVENYNNEISSYNEKISPFNEAVQKIIDANQALDDHIAIIQASIDKSGPPYDIETKQILNENITKAQESKAIAPEKLPLFVELEIDENANNDDLKLVIEKSEEDIAVMVSTAVPKVPDVPDYTKVIEDVEEKYSEYQVSVQRLKQISAPPDDFVISRLKRIDTILEIEAVSEGNDPNGQLNKQGGYIGCIYFSDKQVDKSKLFIEIDSVIEIATDGGGAIEIFKTVAEAKTRETYLAAFDGGFLSSGSHHVLGTVLIRTSRELTASQQNELTQKIIDVLLDVE